MTTVRLIEPEETDRFIRCAAVPFLEVAEEVQVERWRPHVEPGRAWAVVDGDRFVGNACVFSRDLTLPAGPSGLAPLLPMAAISAVGVHPTHRRRGFLRRLMGAMLADAAERGTALAGLEASEAGIYGRFGFGCATTVTEVKVSTRRSAFLTSAPDPGVRLCGAAEASKVLPGLFDRLRRCRAGEVSRDDASWADMFADPVPERKGATGLFYAVADDAYASYRINGDAEGNRLVVHDLFAASSELEAGMWRFLLDVDLVEEVVARPRPVDEPLRWRLADPRQLRVTGVRDFLWLRVIDVPVALAARGYRSEGLLVLQVDPAQAPVGPDGEPVGDPAAGVWSLDASPGGASCRAARRAERADLRMGASDLGSLLLGGVAPSVLAAAGRVTELRPGMLDLADRVFCGGPAPLSQTGF